MPSKSKIGYSASFDVRKMWEVDDVMDFQGVFVKRRVTVSAFTLRNLIGLIVTNGNYMSIKESLMA